MIQTTSARRIRDPDHSFKDKKIQHLHIAGDIANGFEKTSQEFLDQLQCHLPVTFSLGNHDMLGLSEEAIRPFEFQKIPSPIIRFLPFQAGMTTVLFLPSLPKKHLQTKNLFWFDRRLQRIGSDPAITKKSFARAETRAHACKSTFDYRHALCSS